MKLVVRASKVSLKFANSGKKAKLNIFLQEYRRVLSLFVDILWQEKKIPLLLHKELTTKVNTWLSARMVQCAGKQASGIVRGVRRKHEKRIWKLGELQKAGKDTSKLETVINKTVLGKPVLKDISVELDSRFVKTDLNNKTSFDGWINIGCIGNKEKLVIPFKKHTHFNSLLNNGKMTCGLRLRENDATFLFEIEAPESNGDAIIGIDIGIVNCLATSNGQLTQEDIHGHSLTSILKKLSRRKKGSKGFNEAAEHRKNFINWSINQLNLVGVKEVRCEQIKNLRSGKNSGRFLSHWAYAEMFDKLERFCEEQGVLVTKVNPAYTSQTCPKCKKLGVRRGKVFECDNCKSQSDSDINAAINIASTPTLVTSREAYSLPQKIFFHEKNNY